LDERPEAKANDPYVDKFHRLMSKKKRKGGKGRTRWGSKRINSVPCLCASQTPIRYFYSKRRRSSDHWANVGGKQARNRSTTIHHQKEETGGREASPVIRRFVKVTVRLQCCA